MSYLLQDLNDILRTADQLRIRGLTTTTSTKEDSNRQHPLKHQLPQASHRPVASAAVISDKHEEIDEERRQIIDAGTEDDSDPEVIFRQTQTNPICSQSLSNNANAGNISSLRAVRAGSRASQGSLREGNA